MSVTLIFAKEIIPVAPKKCMELGDKRPKDSEDRVGPLFIIKAAKNLPPGMLSVLLVTGLTWVYISTHKIPYELHVFNIIPISS